MLRPFLLLLIWVESKVLVLLSLPVVSVDQGLGLLHSLSLTLQVVLVLVPIVALPPSGDQLALPHQVIQYHIIKYYIYYIVLYCTCIAFILIHIHIHAVF